MLNISRATFGVETNGAMSGIRASATFPMVCAFAKSVPSDPLVSLAAFEKAFSCTVSSGPSWKTNKPGVVKPTPTSNF